MEQGKMSGYGRILQDLDVVEADVDKSTWTTASYKFSEKKKMQYLRQLLMFIIPFWDSRMRETPFLRQKEEYRLLMEGRLQDLKDGTEFVDYWQQKVHCQQHALDPFCCCVFHSAEYFYSCSTVKDGDYDWGKCTERVVEVLDFVQRDELIITFDMSYQFETIKEALVLLRCFRKTMANRDFDYLEQTRTITGDLFQRMEDLPRRVMRLFQLFQLSNSCGKEFLGNELSTLAGNIEKCVCDWRKFRKLNVPKLTLEYPSGIEYETLLCFVDDLQNLVISLYDDLPPQIVQDIRVIQEQLTDYKKALSPTWIKTFVESGISHVISKNIYIAADDVYNALLFSYPSEEALDLNGHDGKSRNIIYAQQMIAGIRDDVNKIYSKYHIGNFFKFARLILEDDVLSKTPATNLLEKLTLLHTFITNTENLFRSTELQDWYLQIEVQFYNAWCKLWSLLREFKCRKDFLTLSLDIIKDITANMPHATDLLLDLIQTVVQMPEANELLHELRESLAIMEDDKLFVKLLYSLGKNLVETFKMEGAVGVIKDVEIGVIEAARTYILFLRESKDDDCPSTTETVKGFEASLIHAYTKFVDLPIMSELEFYDMLVNLKELEEPDSYISDRIGGLRDDLSFCFSFLQRHAMRHERDEEVKQLWTQMMKLGRKVDNMIDTLKEFPNWFNKLRVFYVSEEVMLIKDKFLKFCSTDTSKTEVEIIDANDEKKTENGEANSKDEVSFEEEDSLRTQLTKGSKSLEKISIVGMPGLGKTTLAMSLYKGCAKSFDAKAWCYVGQEFQRKELLRDITRQISERTSSEINVMGVEDLAKLLKQSLLKKKNYFIVLDDVWDVDAWNALQICFPTGNTGSRILLTSRYKTVGESVCGDKNVLELNLLSPDKSWVLLEDKVFGSKSCPDKLCEVGKGIAKKCGGLPLSIVIIAGVLKNKETEYGWNEVERSLDDYLLNGGLNTLELSYKHLSIRMKQCFLYCRTFSKGKEIPKSKLVRLWLAERFVENADDQESLEGAAEKYLVDLVDRSLLMVSKRSSDNRIQTCRIHDLLRDFCVQKANDEKFLVTVDRWDDPASRQLRGRVCFSSTQDQFMLFKSDEGLTQSAIRSLICPITTQRWVDSLCPMSFIFENFKSLTLLDLENLELDSEFCESISGLKLLRYLAVRGWMKSIPSSIGELYNLETLVVEGIRGEVEVPYTIFNLSKLRHLLVNKRARVHVNHSYPNSLNGLQSFSTPVLSRDAGLQMIAWLPNLRKLRCIFLDESFEFSTLNRLRHLESLRVFYHGFGRFSGKLSLSSNLYKLTLSKFRLPWSEIEKIAISLPRLEILKLLFKAFEGQQWSTTATFKNLKYLRMEELDIKEWEASEDNFPRLERLVVRRCKLLQKIPEDFGNIGELMGIEAYWCNPSVAKSVLKIKREQIDCGNRKFETIINPSALDLDEDDELSD